VSGDDADDVVVVGSEVGPTRLNAVRADVASLELFGVSFKRFGEQRLIIGAGPVDSVIFDGDVETGFVHEVMVKAADADEIVEISGPALGPVLDVVSVEPCCSPAAREPAHVVIAAKHRPS